MKRALFPCAHSASEPAGGADEEEAIWVGFCDCGTTGEVPPWSAEEADDEAALTGANEDFLGILGGCRVFWTRASFNATHILSRADSNKGVGNKPADEGKAAEHRQATSSTSTVNLTLSRSESRQDSIR